MREAADQAMSAHAMSVSELTGHLKAVLEETFPAVWVSGEISDLARPRSGHLYFTLKDEQAQIRGVIWRSVASRLPFDLTDGQMVLCHGDIELYAARGTYQLVIRKVQPQGIGGLQLAFERLREKLNAEGLFAADRKRRLPAFPRRLAVVTSPTGAALRDFLEAASHRWPGVELIIFPAQVQGEGSARSIVSALQAAHRYRPSIDLVVLTRGGGSLEDLWSFNEEIVVRAVAASRIPTVSAVGHEIDVTLCDFAADVRALTPTDAATKALPDRELLLRSLTAWEVRLRRSLEHRVDHLRQRLESLARRPVIRHPLVMVHDRSRRLDELDAKAQRAIDRVVRDRRADLQRLAATLTALSPLQVLGRGYSVTIDEQGTALLDAADAIPGSLLRTRLHRGEVASRVTEIRSS